MAASELTAAAEYPRDLSEGTTDNRRVTQSLSVVANALSVMAGKTLTMAFGFLFWLVAAHEFERPQVGLAAGVVAAMMLCTQFAVGGVGSAVITCYADYRRRPSSLLDTSGTVVVLSALAAAGLFLLAASLGLRHLGIVSAHPLYALAFVLMTVFGTVGILLDQLSIALGRGDQVVVRGAAFGAATVLGVAVLPLLFDHADSFAIFAPWPIAGGVNVALGIVQLRRILPEYRFRGRVDRAAANSLLRHGFPNYALTLAERAPGLVLPVIVTETLAPADNATWYAVWMMVWVVYTIPIAAGLSLFAHGSNRPALLRQSAGEAIRIALLVGLVASLVLGTFARFALSLLGSSYSTTGATPLRILLLAFVPLAFVQAYFATSRARRRLREAVLTGWVSAAASVGAATAAAVLGGLTGMALAWLAVQTATAIWAIARDSSSWTQPLERRRRQLIAVRAWLRRTLGPVTVWIVLYVRIGVARLGGTLAAAAIALALWITSLSRIHLGHMNGLGLVSVLPARFYAAIAILTLGFVWTLLRRRTIDPLALALVLVLIVMLFTLAPLVEPVPRFAVTWRHVGIAQAILDTGHVNPRVDAYFNWPGFFILTGTIARLAGFASTLPLAAWAPLYFNLAYLFPLFLIGRALTADRRLTWLGIWVFYVGNWIGQDYFSPQGLSFFLYLVILAMLLRWFVEWPDGDAREHALPPDGQRHVAAADPSSDVRTRRALLACLVFLFLALVPMHQLTPIAVIFSTAALVVTRACRLRWLPALMTSALVAWWATGARTFFNGHLRAVLANVGELNAVVSQNVTNRVGGDAGHHIVADLMLVAGGVMWLLACLGAWQLLRRSLRHRTAAALAVAPTPLLVLQTYGGEMLLRVQLFALPFTAFFAAAFLLGEGRPRKFGIARSAAVAGVCVTLSALFVVARYGNEKMNYFSRGETAAVERLYSLARPGSVLVSGTGNLPWKYRDYENHRYGLVIRLPHWPLAASGSANYAPLVEDVRETMRSSHPPAYLIISRSEEAEVDQLGYGTPGSLARLEAAVAHSPAFRTIYRNPDASIFTLAAPAGKPGRTRAAAMQGLQVAAPTAGAATRHRSAPGTRKRWRAHVVQRRRR
jgi:O-antigen/teichoic acid export membrane protein